MESRLKNRFNWQLSQSGNVGKLVTLFFVASLIILGMTISFVWQTVSDRLVLSRASPVMIALAQAAGMNKKGELIFLRTQPQLVSDTQMESVCASNVGANNSNGFIEQGCYVPSTNRIYIRSVATDLHNLEVSTAAYEMLHPVYLSLHRSGQGSALDTAIQANFAKVRNASLDAQVANFAKTEPGERDLELFSLLGTGYTNISNDLANYYAPYFSNISATIAATEQVTQLFENNQQQLQQFKAQIVQYNRLASNAYATSVRWAYTGNQAEDTYYYDLYRQDVTQENSLINQYNQLLNSYNALVTEYNGTQPVSQLQPTQTQSQ